MREYHLTLPIPPSINSAYATAPKTGRRILSREGRQYKKDCAYHIKPRNEVLFKKAVSMSIIFYFKDKRRRDIDNYVKILQDTLTQYLIYKDDSQIDALLVIRGEIDKENPRAEILVCEELPSNVIPFPIQEL